MFIFFSHLRSESPTQAFLVLILWLYRKFKPLLDAGLTAEQLDEKISHTVIAYDNMCHVDGLKLAKLDLPFQKPFDKMWQRVVKVIDHLHIRNHKMTNAKQFITLMENYLQNTTPWQQSRRMCGRVDWNASFVLCHAFTSFFTCIDLLRGEISILSVAI